MPENLIHSSDIFDAGLPGSLQEVTELLIKLRGELSQTAGEIRGSGSGSAQGVKELVNVANALNDAFKATNNALAVNNDALAKYTAALEANARAKQKNVADTKSLTDAEAKEVEFLSQSLNFLTQNGNRNMNVWKNITQAMTGANMSYNQMKATVQVLEKALRSLSNSWEKESAGAKSAQAAVVRLKEAMKSFDEATKSTAKSTERVSGASRQYKNLTDQEIASVNAFKAALAGSNQERIDAVKNIDMEAKSYNELYALYSAVKEELKSMTKEEVENTEVGKAMVAQSRLWMEHLNNFQKATGNFSLNVGNYRSAFDGLGYSIQQVMREIPSAQNLNQFFLAISNNIPMVADQLKLFKREQEGIAENLKELQEGTKEYMELQAKQMSLGTKLIKSVLNWQTALLAVVFILRQWGGQWVNKIMTSIRNAFSKSGVNEYLRTWRQSMGEIQKASSETFADMTTELTTIAGRLAVVAKGTDEWKEGIKQVNEITHKNLDATTTTIGEVKKVTDEYVRQAQILAKNQAIIEIIEDSNKKSAKRSLARGATSDYQLASILGVDINSDEFKELSELFKARKGWREEVARAAASVKKYGETNPEFAKTTSVKGDAFGYTGYSMQPKDVLRQAKENLANAEKELQNYINRMTAGVIDPKNIKRMIEEEFEIVDDITKKERSAREKKEKEVDYESLWKEYMQSRSLLIEDMYQRERQAELDARTIEVNEDRQVYEERLSILREYARQNNWEVGQLKAEEQALYDQWNTQNEAKEKAHEEKLQQIWEKYEIKRVEAEIKATEVTTEQVKRRVRTRAAEAARNAQVNRNIERLKNQLIELEKIDTKGVKENEENKRKAIEETTAAIEKQRQALDYSQKLKAAGNIFDVFRVSDRLQDYAGNGDKRGLMESILGESLSNSSDEQIADYFEKWFDAAEKAVGEWYNSTAKYISEALDAYVRLAEAKAELAQQDTETAREAYEKEKALMEEGYASRMSAAWEEYQQKKELQKQAEEDAKRAAKVQMDLDTAQQGVSLVTAIANLYKVLSGVNIPFPGAGVALATGLSATLLTAFGVAKAKAYQLAKYGSGGYEEVTEGGTHASGHDTMLGIRNRRGRQMVVERGEGIGVFTRAARARYGSRGLRNLVEAANRGQIGTMALAELERDREGGVQQTFVSAVNLGKIERALDAIERQGAVRYGVDGDGNIVEIKGNTKTIYKK